MTPDYRKPSPNYDDSCSNNHMGGQTPIFFAPASSFIIGHHKPAQDNISSSLEAMLGATCPPNQMSRGPLQLLDFKEVGAGEGSGDQRVMKRPLIYPNCMNYAAATTGEEVSMEHDQEGDYEGGGAASGGEKKGARRLGYEQVKALELAFELENRLEPERKMRLASQLGLQPRQVAVWFQNRRARWKTKQMERDYNLLKNNFEALKADRDKLLQEKHHLQTKLDRLRGHAMESKQETTEEGDQGSPTLASCSLVDDLPTNQQANTAENHLMGKLPSPHQKQENDHSPSSTEYSDNNNNGGATEQSSSMILHQQQQASPTTTKALPADDPESYDHHWRLPPPSQLLYKTNIKNEVPWETPGENGSIHMPIDWYW